MMTGASGGSGNRNHNGVFVLLGVLAATGWHAVLKRVTGGQISTVAGGLARPLRGLEATCASERCVPAGPIQQIGGRDFISKHAR